ncbi:GNAT family N-acetyltransferase [Uliginosibacterium sp. H3]|uniref:GNAT family N-acetyltransferase n=1 Tax=Uliginosibacterium silvisoli TaxID=3114758 RepID=A0ABU6K4D5_9RHOO|nr:GNAT family N-acetyltransferase [Uliginosibacterium sp. H3]
MAQLTLQAGDWRDLGARAAAIRHEVFVVEQGVPLDLEMDDMDEQAMHVVAWDAAGEAIATGRILRDGHIGRIAVRAAWRRQGVGMRVMEVLCKAARDQGLLAAWLNAQLSALAFYQGLGFVAADETFIEAGILHVQMRKFL